MTKPRKGLRIKNQLAWHDQNIKLPRGKVDIGRMDKWDKKVDRRIYRGSRQVKKGLDRNLYTMQKDIQKGVGEIRTYWNSMFGELSRVFNTNPTLKKEYGTPNEFVKGEEFESFALNLFPDRDYILVRRTMDFETNELRYVEESLFYDFTLRHRESRYEFVIECKYRTNLHDNKLLWTKSKEQFDRYKQYEKEKYPGSYYVMMGLGGMPSYPNQIYLVPLSNIKYVGLYPSFLAPYQIPPYPVRCDGKSIYGC